MEKTEEKETRSREQRFRVSWFNFTVHFILAIWLIFLGVYPDDKLRIYGLISTGVFIILVAIIERIKLEVIIRDGKLIIIEGIISKHVKEVFIKDIRTIDIRQNVIERIFGFGDVMIATSATSGYEIILENIGAPYRLKKEIEKTRQAQSN